MTTRNRRERSRIYGSHSLELRRCGTERDQVVPVTLLNVATGGVCLSTRTPIIPGENITLELVDRAGVGTSIPASIIWCEPCDDSNFHLGVEFRHPLNRRYFIRLCALACGVPELQ